MRYIFFLFFISCLVPSFSQSETVIKGTIKNLGDETPLLAYVFGAEQFVIDTGQVIQEKVSFHITDSAEAGLYYIVLQPSGHYAQFIINGDAEISFMADAKNMASATFTGEDNELFRSYVDFIQSQKQKLEESKSHGDASDAARVLGQQVDERKELVIKEYPQSITALILKNAELPKMEPLEEDNDEARMKQFVDFRNHYFDDFDFADPRSMRTTEMAEKIENYLTKYTVQQPDSINASLDTVFSLLEANETAYRYFLSRYTNQYAQSKQIGMDKVYVHLMDTYFSQEKTPWVAEDQLAKNKNNADFIRGTLIGNPAPPLGIRMKDGTDIDIRQIDSKYTIVIFWSPTCSHCKEELPHLVEVYPAIDSLGGTVVALCVKQNEECWEYLETTDLPEGLIHGFPVGASLHKDYDLRMTPRLYILDAEKKIAFKQIKIEQIPDILTALDREKERKGL